jgi:hypothetical protein
MLLPSFCFATCEVLYGRKKAFPEKIGQEALCLSSERKSKRIADFNSGTDLCLQSL